MGDRERERQTVREDMGKETEGDRRIGGRRRKDKTSKEKVKGSLNN